MLLLAAGGKAPKRRDGSSQPLLSHLGSAPASAESSPGLEAVFKASVGATEVSGETACSLAMGCLEEILSTRERGWSCPSSRCACCCSRCPIPPSPLPILQARSQAEESQPRSHSTAHLCVQDHAADKDGQSRTCPSHRPLPATSGGHRQWSGRRRSGRHFIQALFHVGIYYLILTCFSSDAEANAKPRISPLISLGPFGPCSTCYACSDVLHLNPSTSGNGEGKSRTPMPCDLLCAVCSLQKLLFLAFTTLKENALHFAANWSAEGKYTHTSPKSDFAC